MIERAVCANANDVKGKRTPIMEYVNVYTIHLEHGEAVVSPIALEYQRQVQVLRQRRLVITPLDFVGTTEISMTPEDEWLH